MPTRRELFAAAPAFLQNTAKAKNIVLLIADDLGLHTGAYGDATAKTPNLDRMAAEGIRFTNAYCTTASCSASRSVILSGLQNHTSGHFGHAHAPHNFSYLPAVKSAPELLRARGYRTGVIAKLHVNPLYQFPWDMNATNEGGRDVHAVARRAREFVQASQGKPFYLHVGFTDPHRAGNGFANRDYPGVTRNRFDPAKVRLPAYLPDNRPTREEVAEYYEASNRLDQGVGMIFDVLREAGQLDNSLVVFISDNGMPFPNAKTNCYDAGLHLPMIVRAPGARRGVLNNAMVNWTDLLPTFLEWSGAKGPDYPLQGKSLLPVLDQENPTGRDEVFFSHTFHEVTTYYPVRGMRNRRFKYIRNLYPELSYPHASDLWASKTWQSVLAEGERAKVGGRAVGAYLHRTKEELYDVSRDPDELENLAGTSAHRETLEKMRRRVQEWRVDTKDPWLTQSLYDGEEIPGRPPPNVPAGRKKG
ncbi:MAG: sulfatase [Bryobacteraceae bacterium]